LLNSLSSHLEALSVLVTQADEETEAKTGKTRVPEKPGGLADLPSPPWLPFVSQPCLLRHSVVLSICQVCDTGCIEVVTGVTPRVPT
jgi:hypothetical protein